MVQSTGHGFADGDVVRYNNNRLTPIAGLFRSSVILDSHGFQNGDAVQYTTQTGVTVITGLTNNLYYQVFNKDSNRFQLMAYDGTIPLVISVGAVGNPFLKTTKGRFTTGPINFGNEIKSTAHGFVVGDVVRYNANGVTTAFTPPPAANLLYKVGHVAPDFFRFQNQAQDGELDLAGGLAGHVFEKVEAQIALAAATADDNRIEITAHGFLVGDLVTYTTNGATAEHAATAIEDGKTYLISDVTTTVNEFTLTDVAFTKGTTMGYPSNAFVKVTATLLTGTTLSDNLLKSTTNKFNVGD